MTGDARRPHRTWIAPWCSQATDRVKPRWSPTPRICPLCGRDITDTRRTWCSYYCSDLAAICSNPRAAREFVWGRDGGMCALAEEGCEVRRDGMDDFVHRPEYAIFTAREGLKPWSAEWDEISARRYIGPRKEYGWQVDHIEELVDGGSHWPGNMQILCSYHHKVKGAVALAARRAGKVLTPA